MDNRVDLTLSAMFLAGLLALGYNAVNSILSESNLDSKEKMLEELSADCSSKPIDPSVTETFQQHAFSPDDIIKIDVDDKRVVVWTHEPEGLKAFLEENGLYTCPKVAPSIGR